MDLNSMYAYCKAANYNLQNRPNNGNSSLGSVYRVILDHCPEHLPNVFPYFFGSSALEHPGMNYSSVDPVVAQAHEALATMSHDLFYQGGKPR